MIMIMILYDNHSYFVTMIIQIIDDNYQVTVNTE